MEPAYVNREVYAENQNNSPYIFQEEVKVQHAENVWTSQPEATRTQAHSTESKADKQEENCCMGCCRSTHRCLMSGECGRALNIASVVAMCGMCLRFFICKLITSHYTISYHKM